MQKKIKESPSFQQIQKDLKKLRDFLKYMERMVKNGEKEIML